MLSKKLQNEGTIFSYALVSDWFASVHNPKYVGENFKWDDFPRTISEFAGNTFMTSIVCNSEKTYSEVERFVKETSFSIAKRMVEQMQRD